MQYSGLITKIGLYAEDGAEILIKNGWLEHPPLAEDREHLANNQ
jgi:hypothetical protein